MSRARQVRRCHHSASPRWFTALLAHGAEMTRLCRADVARGPNLVEMLVCDTTRRGWALQRAPGARTSSKLLSQAIKLARLGSDQGANRPNLVNPVSLGEHPARDPGPQRADQRRLGFEAGLRRVRCASAKVGGAAPHANLEATGHVRVDSSTPLRPPGPRRRTHGRLDRGIPRRPRGSPATSAPEGRAGSLAG